jgi:hypothetical protein
MSTMDSADWGSILMSSVLSAEEEDVVLISKEEKQFRINADIAKAASPYFAGVLENKMLEAGTRTYIHTPCALCCILMAVPFDKV